MARRKSLRSDITIPGTCYLVGGAVRDELLGLQVTDRDWVVVGATAEEMRDARFLPVGRAFPVFLHPQTHEEYALARVETKTGAGHGGFSFQSDPNVTLEQDLHRRDLTINAIAKAKDGTIIDPFNGRIDLEKKQFRHVSAAFGEDPLRCFRVARFAARMPEFKVHTDTLKLMSTMQSELSTLSAERVWNEWMLALGEISPGRFYEVIESAKVQDPWFSGLKLEDLALRHRDSKLDRSGCFALIGWLHDSEFLQEHLDRLKAPNKVRQLALNIANFGRDFANLRDLDSERVLEIFKLTNALHSHTNFHTVIQALAHVADVDSSFILELQRALQRVKVEGETGPELGQKIDLERLMIIEKLRHS